MKASVVIKLKGSLVLELKHSFFDKNKVRALNSIHEVMCDSAFSIFLTKFSTEDWMQSKNTVVALTAQSPIALINLSGAGVQDLCRRIDIFLPILPDPIAQYRDYQSRSTSNDILERDALSRYAAHCPNSVLLVIPPTPEKHDADPSLLPKMREIEEEDSRIELAIDKFLSDAAQTHLLPSSLSRPRWMKRTLMGARPSTCHTFVALN